MARDFPLSAFFFDVTFMEGALSGPLTIGFQELQGLGADIEYKELKDFTNSDHTNRSFEKIKYKNLILKKGVFHDGMKDMLKVSEIFYRNNSGMRNVTVRPMIITINLKAGNQGQEDVGVVQWTLKGCVPVKYEYSPMNAMESNILVETMEFIYHSMETKIKETTVG